jgi:hypothetical protein
MDFITLKLNKKISFLEKSNTSTSQLIPYYQSKIEYFLTLVMAYLWDTHFLECKPDSKERLLEIVSQPTLGQILEICRILDSKEKKILTKKLSSSFSKYLNTRNHKIGHGYTYEDKIGSLQKEFKDLLFEIEDKELIDFMRQDFDLVCVERSSDNSHEGVAYRSNGDYDPWSCPKRLQSFQTGNIYLLDHQGKYFRISPFIQINSEDDFFVFNKIQERLTGKIKYNQIIKTGTLFLEWPDFTSLSIENDDTRRKSSNKTIINAFENNYNEYIELGPIKDKVKDFVLNNKASVAATVWGHGGVGKTATIQHICEELLNGEKKIFDYIIFLSAKDRLYDYLTGTISSIEGKINSFESLIRKINHIVFREEKFEIEKILSFEGKIFLVIDDYETFLSGDKEKIEEFIRKLDINHHKVVVTTRANLVLGHEIQINELSPEETRKFLINLQEIEFPNSKPFQESELTNEKIQVIHEITSGRPLFIFQFAYVVAQKGMNSAIKKDYKSDENAVGFLYGKIFDYLSSSAQNVFIVMGLLTADDDDLTNLLEKVKYILNMEHQDDAFYAAISELEKLRIIEIIESRFFRVYSQEIQSIMLKYYQKSDSTFKRRVSQRLNQVSRDKSLDNEWALLKNADNSRYSKNEQEVIANYRQILNRPGCPHEIKLQAIINLGSYLFAERGKKEEAIQIMEDYTPQYIDDHQYVKMFSTYTWSMVARSQREKSIQILLDYFSKRGKERSLSIDINIELLGNLLTNRSIYWIDRREETKSKQAYEEISLAEYRDRNKQETEEFRDIYKNQGMHLFNFIKNKEINKLSSGARQNVVAGLYQFVNICIRIKKYDVGSEVCRYALKETPEIYSNQFSKKLQTICKFSAKPTKSNKSYNYRPL